MNLRQEAKLSMYLVVKDFLITNTSLLTPLPNYAGFYTAFTNGITLIQSNSEQQMFNKSGLKTNKSLLRNSLVMTSADNSRKVRAYAKFTNNNLLLTETKFSESDLKNATDNELRDMTQGLYDRIQVNLTALAPYGITAATQTAFLNAITAFVASIPKPRAGAIDTRQGTIQLNNSFKVVDAALENIDILVDIIKLSQPVLYSGYKLARKIIVTGVGSLAVKGLVTDAVSGDPLKGVSLMFALDGDAMRMKGAKPAKDYVKKTADKGGFMIKSLPAGMYSVTVSKAGYADQIVSIAVSDGELTDLRVSLTKA